MTLYTSTLSQAPVLSPLDDSLLDVFKKCLVTGFGSFSGLGWFILYEAPEKIVFKNSSGDFLVLDALATEYTLVGAFEIDDVLDFSFPNKHTYKFFPSIYTHENGLHLDKSLIDSSTWSFIGNQNYFYFIHKDLVVFFGRHSGAPSAGTCLVVTTEFGLFQSDSTDHILSNVWDGFHSPVTLGKEEHYLTDTGYQFSNLYLINSVYNKTLGVLPDCFVLVNGFDFEESEIRTSLGKALVIRKLNSRYLFFNHNG